jgi:hypothetical protein
MRRMIRRMVAGFLRETIEKLTIALFRHSDVYGKFYSFPEDISAYRGNPAGDVVPKS